MKHETVNEKACEVCQVTFHRNIGKANRCERCGLNEVPEGAKRYFQWANISRKYMRDLSDWEQMCVKCHKKVR